MLFEKTMLEDVFVETSQSSQKRQAFGVGSDSLQDLWVKIDDFLIVECGVDA